MTIRQKIFFGFFGIALLIGLVSYISVSYSQKALERSVGENFVVVAEKLLQDLDIQIFQRIEQVRIYAKDMADEELIRASNTEFDGMDDATAYMERIDRKWTAEPKSTLTPFMLQLIGNDLSNEIREELVLEDYYQREYGYVPLVEVFVTNKYGANVAQTHKTSDYYQGDEEWWQRAKNEGKYIQGVAYDESADRYSINIAIRIDDTAGDFIGVIKAVLNIETVVSTIKEFETAEKEEHGDHDHGVYSAMHSLLLSGEGRVLFSQEHDFFEDVSGVSHVAGILNATSQDYFTEKCEISGDEELFAYAHSKGYKNYKGLGWVLVLMVGQDDVFAPSIDLRNTLTMLSLGVMVLAIMGSFVVSSSIASPISELKEVASEIGKGNLDVKVEARSKDEVGFLADSIKKMTVELKRSQEKLDNYNKRLEKEVDERTMELEEARTDLENTVQKRTAELQEKLAELERFRTATIDREFRVEELNREIERLKGAEG